MNTPMQPLIVADVIRALKKFPPDCPVKAEVFGDAVSVVQVVIRMTAPPEGDPHPECVVFKTDAVGT